MGTPLYMSPEAVSQPDTLDARADVYAVGAVGYFMLTGSPVFTGTTVVEICMKHVHEVPQAPSARCGKPIIPVLETLLLRCLAKAPADRPASAAFLLRELSDCGAEDKWSADDADTWWDTHKQTMTKANTGAATLPPTRSNLTSPSPSETVAYEGKGTVP